VTPESTVGEEFAAFLNRLRAMRQLDCIAVDECHVVLNQRYTFRKQMQQLGKLVAAETQILMLTATWNSIGKCRVLDRADGPLIPLT
jgi:superfamily II DNA helicase RecQ